jgi:trypsin
VRIGSRDLASGGEVINVLAVINHPYFDSYSFDYDYALLKLTTLIVVDGITKAIIRLPSLNEPIADSTYTLVSGWGTTRSFTESNKVLRGVIVPTVNQDKCNQIYRYDGGVTKQMVCAAAPGKDSCSVSFLANKRGLGSLL